MNSFLPWHATPDTGPVAARIAAATAERIVDGRLGAGEWVTEAGIAEPWGASRTPAREAMVQLSRWGLVRLVPKKGALVTTVTPEERRDLLDVRVMVECRAVETVADERPALVTRLAEVVAAQREALERGDISTFADLDVTFHLGIIGAGGNAVVDELMATLGPRFARLIHHAVTGNPRAATVFCDEHARLAELVAAGDSSAFETLLERHVAFGHGLAGQAR
ncbi:GntR family transcriptional regulator [Aestuariimicrobium soli]|uniref:GntR family transcriptional regulator n=1 Tax=Aestuariimicrobium soli TaxID=2035834 RepID=UPI003EB968AC